MADKAKNVALEEALQNSSDVGMDTELSLLCRICGLPNEYLIPIFEGEGQENELADKIHSYLPIKVNQTDNYPDNVCYQCASTLLAFHDLFKCCVEANVTLCAKVVKGGDSTNKKCTSKPTDDASKDSQERLLRGRFADITESSTKGKKLASPLKSLTLTESRLNRLKPKVPDQEKEINTHICSFCSQPFNDSDILTTHLLDIHADLLFHCDVCGSYLDRKELIPHMSKHAEQYAQKEVSTIKKEGTKPTEKINNNTVESPLLVNDEAFSTSSHSNDGFGPLPDSVFEAIKDTEDNHDVDNSKVVSDKNDQQKTEVQEKSAKNTETNRIICPICSKEFRLPSSYHYHKKHYHGGVKEHSCNVCGRNFAVKSALTAHLTLHTGTKPYSCPQCSKEFRSKASVYIHYKNIHCESKRFTCTTCDRSFRWKQKLLRHMASHTKEKKHFCEKCNKGFGVKYDLTRHMKSHVDTKKYICDKCNTAFSQPRYLKNHVDKKHSTTRVKPNDDKT